MLLNYLKVVVDRNSAELGLPGSREHVIELDFDHQQICKLTNDAVFQRILRHIKRLVDTATRAVTDNQSDNELQIDQRKPSTHDATTSMAPSSPLFSTIDCIESVTNVGFEALMKQLTQWLPDDSSFLILYGLSGSGLVQIS